MKKRNLLAFVLIAVLAFTLGMGTVAFYKKTFTSNDNVVRAAKFEVDWKNTLDETVEFDLSKEPIYPGYNNDEVCQFEINKNGTEVPVKYNVTVTPKGDLFENVGEHVSPVNLVLYRNTKEGWVTVGSTFEINPVENPVEKFRIGLNWGHTDYDIEYQNKTGKVEINVVAEQIEGEPEEPTPEPQPDPTITSIKYKEQKSQGQLKGYLNLQFENLPEGAYYQRIIYKTKDGKNKGTYQGIRQSSWYSIDLKENIVGQKINIEICNEGKTITYYTFTDIDLPNPIQ